MTDAPSTVLTPYWVVLGISFAIILLGWLLDRGTLQWLLGHGFVGVWSRQHRLEEAMILLAPVQTVIAASMHDEERLIGSKVPNWRNLVFRIQQARAVLVATSGVNGIWNIAQPSRRSGTIGALNPQPRPPIDDIQAREWLREVRYAINTYRDENWSGIVRARNNLYTSMLVATSLGMAFALLAVVASTESQTSITAENFIAAGAFFLVGATAGIFGQLSTDSRSSWAIEDYGLQWARRINVPILSGLAGLLAAVLIPLFAAIGSSTTNGTQSNNAGSNNQPGTTITIEMPALSEIFSLKTHMVGIVMAAVVGASPAVLAKRLRSEAERYETALSQTAGPPPDTGEDPVTPAPSGDQTT